MTTQTPQWRIIVQDETTGKYLTKADSWVTDQREARPFVRVHVASEHCVQLKLHGVRVLVGVVGEDGRLTSCMKLSATPRRERVSPL